MQVIWEYIELEDALHWLSTLGGAFSNLGEHHQVDQLVLSCPVSCSPQPPSPFNSLSRGVGVLGVRPLVGDETISWSTWAHDEVPYKPVFRIRIRLVPFHFGLPDPDPLHETDSDPGGKKISRNHGKFQQKSQEYHVFKKIINFCLADINIYLILTKQIIYWEIYF